MINERNRLDHWSTGHTSKNQGDSPPILFEKNLDLFRDKYVLEIGPGEGRQHKIIENIIKGYCIADIVENVFDYKMFQNADKMFLLRDLNVNLEYRFELIHFWYVIHHVPTEELRSFFGFVNRHLVRGGIVMFNTPYLDFHEGAYADDGVNTTKHTLLDIMREIENLFFCMSIDGSQYSKSNGHVYVGKKIDTQSL